jgi:surface antigen
VLLSGLYEFEDRPVTRIDAWRGYRAFGPAGEALRAVMAGVLLLATGACSILMPAMEAAEEPLTTQSIAPKTISPLSADLGEEDWRRAKAALAVALDPQGAGTAVSWDNPDTTIKGNFTPVGQPYVKNDDICRAFLATINGQGSAASLQGTACRPSGGDWVIKDVKPFKKA